MRRKRDKTEGRPPSTELDGDDENWDWEDWDDESDFEENEITRLFRLDCERAFATTGDETPIPTDEAEPLEAPLDPADALESPRPAAEGFAGLLDAVPPDLGGEAAEGVHLEDNPDEAPDDVDQLFARMQGAEGAAGEQEGEVAGGFEADLKERPAWETGEVTGD